MAAESTAHAAHPPHLAHHFDTPAQQFESGKLGMWLFLGTELLMFGGLFCAYSIFRGNHPDMFAYAHQFLDVTLGGINTVVLICSSFTMAYGVRAAQLGKKGLLVAMLALTLLCAAGFLGIKYVEYTHKIQHGLLWGNHWKPQEHGAGHGADTGHAADAGHAATGTATDAATDGHGTAAPADGTAGPDVHAAQQTPADAHSPAAPDPAASAPAPAAAATATDPNAVEHTTLPPPASAPGGLAAPKAAADTQHAPVGVPANPQIFFGIYFAMTGLHGIHVLAGMVVIGWLLIGAMRGAYGPDYFTPVDLVGLYWHIVDLIWIFLFPLLYLIH